MDKIKFTDIQWGKRNRSEYGDIDDLAESIKEHGLIQPVVLDDDNTLLAGGRRLTAIALLGWEEVPIVYMGSLPPLKRLEIELEENLRRKDLTWQEESKLKLRIDKLKKELYGDKWKTEDTAKLFNCSPRHVYREIELANSIVNHPEVANEKDKKTAQTRVRRIKEAAVRKVAAQLNTNQDSNLHLGDSLDIMRTIPDNSIDLVIFDPPFAVNFTEKEWAQKYATVYGDMKDIPDVVIPMVESIVKEIKRVLKDGAHAYIFFALNPELYYKFHSAVSPHLSMQNQLLFWIKDGNANPSPYQRFAVNYEPFFFCWKGKQRNLKAAHNATFMWGTDKGDKKCHPAQKPLGLYTELINLSTQVGETVLDPMMGSGISMATAHILDRKYIGIEKEEVWYNLALANVRELLTDGD
jgi:ParB/RepB/Spo0J family partition protein